MNLNPLFPVQAELNKKIEKEHGLEEQDLKKKKIVALLTELYGCVNEARFFKFWSKDQKARTYAFKELDAHQVQEWNPLLEEYADTIHTTLMVALEYGYTEHDYKQPNEADLNDRVIDIAYLVSSLPYVQEKVRDHQISLILDYTIAFGYQLGFTEEEVIEAYHKKNAENHARQNNGY